MTAGKEIIVLSGGAHRGVVKLTASQKPNHLKITCSVDFRPNGAILYIVGDEIAELPLYDLNSEFEVPFRASGEIGCMVRSSSLTMFGGKLNKSLTLKRIDDLKKRKAQKPSPDSPAEDGSAKNSEPIIQSSPIADIDPIGDWTRYDGKNFYYAVKPQLDEMFVCYPADSLLEDTVPNSKWVRVDAEDGYYVVGILFVGDAPSYICYGVPQYPDDDGRAPAELENMCVWLPVDSPSIKGYWVIYQSAETGEIVK